MSEMPDCVLFRAENENKAKAPVSFWITGVLLTAYVAACTGQRENNLGADAWEHLRVLHVLSQQLWHPGNPTFASDLPSVRYSPYMVGLALVCRTTGADAYNVLSFAAVLNTCLLILSLWSLLSMFGEQASATAV